MSIEFTPGPWVIRDREGNIVKTWTPTADDIGDDWDDEADDEYVAQLRAAHEAGEHVTSWDNCPICEGDDAE